MKSRYKFLAAIGLTLCFCHPAAVLADTDPQASQNTQPDQSTVNPQPATEQTSQDNNKQQDNPQAAQVLLSKAPKTLSKNRLTSRTLHKAVDNPSRIARITKIINRIIHRTTIPQKINRITHKTISRITRTMTKTPSPSRFLTAGRPNLANATTTASKRS